GQDPETFVSNVDSSGTIAIMHHPTAAHPMAIRERQFAVDRSTAATQARRRKEAIDHNKVLAVPLALIGQLSPKLSHRGVREALGQLGSRKTFERQILDADAVVVVDELGRQLVQEVSSLVGDSPLDTCDDNLCSCPPLASGLPSGEHSLGLAKLALPLAEELRGRDRFPTGDGCEGLQTEIDADNLCRVGSRQWNVWHVELDSERDVPFAIGGTAERGTLGLLFHGSRLSDTDLPHLGDIDLAIGDLDPLGDAKPRRVAFLALEARIAGTLLEEVGEGPMQVVQYLLEGLRVGFLEPRRLRPLFECGQLGGKLLETDRLPRGLVGLLPPGKGP